MNNDCYEVADVFLMIFTVKDYRQNLTTFIFISIDLKIISTCKNVIPTYIMIIMFHSGSKFKLPKCVLFLMDVGLLMSKLPDEELL